MTRGYLVMAQGSTYAKQAESLAESIKQSQSQIASISVITDQLLSKDLFDNIISIENDLAVNSLWKIENRVQFYDLTPYDETVILDADMLFLSDVSHWWRLLEKYELLLTNKVKTYRGDWVTENNPYRSTFIQNELPNVYSAFTYFKKTDLTKEFFQLVKEIISNWDNWIYLFAPKKMQKFPSIDLAMSIAVSILGIEETVTSSESFPTFTHMKARIQDINVNSEHWNNYLGIFKTENGIKIGPYLQSGILHYVKKDFV